MLWLRTLLFALVVPGTVAVAIPILLAARAHAEAPGALRWLGALIAAAGWVLLGWCCRDFVVRGRGTPNPLDPPRALVVSGPYRFTRNPMYVGALLSIVGIAAFTGARVLLLYAAGFFLVAQLFVRLHEERRLGREFGAEYDRYRARVPRWLGIPRAGAGGAIVAALVVPASLLAQTVRGTASTGGRTPVPGVVLLLVDSAGATVRRALSDEGGAFAIAAPAPGRYRLRTLRIGFRPLEAGPLALRAGGDTTLRLALEAVPVALARVVVTARRGQCGARADAATASAALWEAVRAALEAQQATAAARRYEMRLARRERRYDADGTTLREAARTEIESTAQQSFASLPADSLALVGYVTPAGLVTADGGEVEYRGPDAPVLLSDRFARDHCFDVVASADPEQRLLGLAFRPAAPARGERADVRGTLWVDRLTSELRRIEFAYEGLPAEARGRAGGRVEYLPLPTGGWIIRDWEIRMPVMRDASVRGTDPTTGRPALRPRLALEGVHASGGSVVDVRARGRMVWTARTARLEGVVRGLERGPAPRVRVAHAEGGAPRVVALDSLGRFRFDSLEPGPYRLVLDGLLADSLGLAPDTARAAASDGAPARVELRPPHPAEVARRLCGREARDSSARAIVGTVRDAAGAPVAGASVLAAYLADARVSGRASVTIGRREARTDHAGAFLICDVSPDRPVELRAIAPRGASTTATVRLRFDRGYGAVDLRLP